MVILPLLVALAIYANWRFGMPFVRSPILTSEIFIVRYVPLWLMALGGVFASLAIYLQASEYLSILLTGAVIMMFSAIISGLFAGERR